MNYHKIIEPYFDLLGMRIVKGDTRSIMPLGIFCLHDSIYQIFNKDIKGIKLEHQANKWRNEWRKTNDAQFKKFFLMLDDDQRDAIIDIMDDFENYTQENVEEIRLWVKKCLFDIPKESQEIIASLQLCNVMGHLAAIRWNELFVKRVDKRPRVLPYNEAVIRYSALLSDEIYKKAGGRMMDEDALDELAEAEKRYDTKYINWVNERSK